MPFQLCQIGKTQAAVAAVKEGVAANGAGSVHNEAVQHFAVFIVEVHTKAKAAVSDGQLIPSHGMGLNVFHDCADLLRVADLEAFPGISVKNGDGFYLGGLNAFQKGKQNPGGGCRACGDRAPVKSGNIVFGYARYACY